jgi:hypothetical protein
MIVGHGDNLLPVGPENPSQPSTSRWVPVSSRRSPLIMVMQPTHLWDFPDWANLRPLDRPRHRTIHVQCPMCTPVMIILNWLRVLGTTERSQINQRICHQLHAIVPLLDAFKTQQQPLEFILPGKGPLHLHT